MRPTDEDRSRLDPELEWNPDGTSTCGRFAIESETRYGEPWFTLWRNIGPGRRWEWVPGTGSNNIRTERRRAQRIADEREGAA